MHLLLVIGLIFFILITFNTKTKAYTLKYNKNNYVKPLPLINQSVPMVGKTSEDYQLLKELKGTCEITNDCRSWAYVCRAELCECAEGYIPDATNKTCIGAIGKLCMYDSHCITKAYCRGQTICTCKAEYPLVSEDKWSCEDDFSKATRNSFVSSTISITFIWFYRFL